MNTYRLLFYFFYLIRFSCALRERYMLLHQFAGQSNIWRSASLFLSVFCVFPFAFPVYAPFTLSLLFICIHDLSYPACTHYIWPDKLYNLIKRLHAPLDSSVFSSKHHIFHRFPIMHFVLAIALVHLLTPKLYLIWPDLKLYKVWFF